MFHFVPRKVAQRTRPALSAPDAPVPGPSALVLTPDEAPNQGTDAKKAKGKNKATDVSTDEDIATLLTLALSDHALWSNVELCRAVSAADDGWVPLSFLVQRSTYLLHLEQRPPDSVLVRAIRGHAEDVLEVRMRVTAPSKEAWYGQRASPDEGGGYEVRLKHSADALSRAGNFSRNEWEERTVYVENVPLAHRTVPGIHRFLSSLLPVPTPSSPPASTCTSPPLPSPGHTQTQIQAITLPPHHLDRPGTPPKCKGFALVTFACAADATRLATDWPWLPRRTAVPHETEAETENRNRKATEAREREAAAEEDAVKFGFRALPKARWDALKEEYLAYRQTLLDAIADADADVQYGRQAETAAPSGEGPADPVYAPTRTRTTRDPGPGPEFVAPPQPPLAPSAPYPPGCLVFVRGVHPETNKTTLKALLGAHASRVAAADALDYVDYAKGMVSCHVRVSTPSHARALVTAFTDRPLVQMHGLDGTGSLPPSANSTSNTDVDATPKRITAELVDGEREALYWHKVPEKVRREAVRKAIALAQSQSAGGGGDEDVEMTQEEHGAPLEGEGEATKSQSKRPRKRRRKA
ncbi:hypothetical protein GSI_01342 [Ganoderma sinense ZZ0214-1]|uniref:XRRM domain-containing protein n=1 Tax=Ganoderma sinense ZZ0214-1 TaxID=1077348 RepID=A0A2G8SVP9_9APHY|nr:hypothetical protein GSI_01342 [Ganoderma sinense ZZ0214-1]